MATSSNTTDTTQTSSEPPREKFTFYQPSRVEIEAGTLPQADRNPSAKSTAERLRKPVSRAVAAVFCFLLIFVYPRGFGTLPMEVVKLVGLFLVFAGTLGRILCTLYIGGRKNRELCQSGIYAMCRNPLYFFSFLGLTGICLVAQNLTLTITAASFYLIFYRTVIDSEEKKLLGLFPKDFATYQQSVPRFWPRGFPPRDSQILRVDTGVFIRSLTEVLWFLAAVIGVEAIGMLRSQAMIHSLLSWY